MSGTELVAQFGKLMPYRSKIVKQDSDSFFKLGLITRAVRLGGF